MQAQSERRLFACGVFLGFLLTVALTSQALTLSVAALLGLQETVNVKQLVAILLSQLHDVLSG